MSSRNVIALILLVFCIYGGYRQLLSEKKSVFFGKDEVQVYLPRPKTLLDESTTNRPLNSESIQKESSDSDKFNKREGLTLDVSTRCNRFMTDGDFYSALNCFKDLKQTYGDDEINHGTIEASLNNIYVRCEAPVLNCYYSYVLFKGENEGNRLCVTTYGNCLDKNSAVGLYPEEYNSFLDEAQTLEKEQLEVPASTENEVPPETYVVPSEVYQIFLMGDEAVISYIQQNPQAMKDQNFAQVYQSYVLQRQQQMAPKAENEDLKDK